MKRVTVEMRVYEVGDVLALKAECFKLSEKRRSFGSAKRAIVIGVTCRADSMRSYRMISDKGRMLTLTPAEQGMEKYLGNIDLGLLLEDGGEGDDGHDDPQG